MNRPSSRSVALFIPLILTGIAVLLLPLTQKSEDSSSEASGGELPSAVGSSAVGGEFEDWLTKHAHTPESERAASLVRGMELAAGRREEMLALIQKEPELALERALSWHQWEALPTEIKALVERPFSTTDDYRVASDCGVGAERGKRHLTWFGDLRVYPTAAWEGVTSKDALPAQGIEIHGHAALRPGMLQILDNEDAAAVAASFPSSTSGGPTDNTELVALLGGVRVGFPNRGRASEISDALLETLTLPGPLTAEAAITVAFSDGGGEGVLAAASAASLAWSNAPKRVLVIRCDFSDLTGAPQTQADLQDNLDQASDSLLEMSYGNTWLSTQTVTSQVVRMPKTAAAYDALPNSNRNKTFAEDAKVAAEALGYVRADYDIFVYSFKPTAEFRGAFAWLGKGEQWDMGVQDADTYLHEFGHNYGLGHSNFWVRHQAGGDWNERSGINTNWGAAGNDEYGDVFGMMSVQYRTRPGIETVWQNGHFSMNNKVCLGWMELSRVVDVTTDGIHRIHRFDHPDAHDSGNKLGLTFRTGGGKRIWAGLRRNFPSNHTLSTGAYLVWGHRPNQHRQLDCTPFSQIDGIKASITTDPETMVTTEYDHADFDRDDSALAVGASWTAPDGSVRLTNLGFGGTAPHEYLDLQVEFFDDISPYPDLEFYTDQSFTTTGFEGSYFNGQLIASGGDDWNTTNTRAGSRVDDYPRFFGSDWEDRAALGITGGTDDDWDNFSVQWDGYIKVTRPGVTADLEFFVWSPGTTGGRFWIDRDQDGTLSTAERRELPHGTLVEAAPLTAGTYKVRMQTQHASGEGQFIIYRDSIALGAGDFEIYQDAALTEYGLTSAFVNSSLRAVTSQADWTTTQTISGTRADEMPLYWDNQMGPRAGTGVTGGSDGNWQNFSVQYDGWIKVLRRTRFTTYASDGARFWIDTNGNGSFGSTSPEFNASTWGEAGRGRYSPFSGWVDPGTYKLRIQHEIGTGSNRFAFMGQPDIAFADGHGITLTGAGSLTAPAGDPVTGSFTFEAWVKPATTGLMTIFSTRSPAANYGFTAKLSGGTRIIGHIGTATGWLDTTATVDQNYRAGEWMHVAYVVTPAGYTIYINGWMAQEESFSGTPVLVDADHPISIGRDGLFGEEFIGQIDEMRIWDVPLSGEQIAANMRRNLVPTEHLISCWRFDGPPTATSYTEDIAGQRDAILSGSASFGGFLTPVYDRCSILQNLPASLDVRLDGEIVRAGEDDWYCIEITEPGTLEFWTTGTTDTIGALYQQGFGGEPWLEVDDVGSDRNFRAIYDVIPATYYIRVSGYSTRTGSYQLHVNAHDEILPTYSKLESEGGSAVITLDTRVGRTYRLLESTDLDRWSYMSDGASFLGTGGRIRGSIGGFLGADRKFLLVSDSGSKALFAARLTASSSSPGSSTVQGQTAGYLFQPGSPENLGDTGLLLDGEPLPQNDGVTIASTGSIASYKVVAQSPGELTDDTASFPAGAWIATNTTGGNEAFGTTLGLVHFPFGDGWFGGHISAAGNYLKTNTPPGFGIQPVQPGLVSVWHPASEVSPFKGALFVTGAENLGVPNVVSLGTDLAPDNSTIGWKVAINEASAPSGTPHGADWSFVYVPYDTEGIVTGWVDGDGSTIVPGTVDFSCSWDAANGRYLLQIPSMGDLSAGTFILNACDNISVGGGLSRPRDCHFEWTLAPGGGPIEIYPTTLPLSGDIAIQCGFVFAYVPFDRVVLGPGR